MVNRLFDQLYGNLVLAELIGDDPEQVQRIWIVWLDLQNSLVQVFGFRQAPRAVMFQRELYRILNGEVRFRTHARCQPEVREADCLHQRRHMER